MKKRNVCCINHIYGGAIWHLIVMQVTGTRSGRIAKGQLDRNSLCVMLFVVVVCVCDWFLAFLSCWAVVGRILQH